MSKGANCFLGFFSAEGEPERLTCLRGPILGGRRRSGGFGGGRGYGLGASARDGTNGELLGRDQL